MFVSILGISITMRPEASRFTGMGSYQLLDSSSRAPGVEARLVLDIAIWASFLEVGTPKEKELGEMAAIISGLAVVILIVTANGKG